MDIERQKHDIKSLALEELGSTRMQTRDSINDAELLASMGHKEELRREFSVWSLGSLCLCLMATWEALSSVVATALISGGPPCLFYN